MDINTLKLYSVFQKSREYQMNSLDMIRFTNNYVKLQSQESGDRLMVRNGQLEKVEGLWNRFYYYFCSSECKQAVKNEISWTIRQIEVKNQNFVTEFLDGELSLNTMRVRDLLFEKMSRMSDRVFDRAVIREEMAELIYPDLQSAKAQIEDREYWVAVEQVRLAQKLGVDFQPISKGSSKSYFGLDRFGNRKIVFKPKNEGVQSVESPKWQTKLKAVMNVVFPFFRSGISIQTDRAYLAEVAASVVDKVMGLHVTPLTKIDRFQSDAFTNPEISVGSCQVYVEDAVTANNAYGLSEWLTTALQRMQIWWKQRVLPEAIRQSELEKLAILHFVIGNQDGHFSNILVKDEKAFSIDNGCSMGQEHPSSYLSKRNQYFWGYLPQSQKVFSDEAKQIVAKLDLERLFNGLEKIEADAFSEEQMQRMGERISVLKGAMEQGWTIYQLSQVKSETDFENARIQLGI